MEVQRLRVVLGTNDAAAALETATIKVSALSEELHAARWVESAGFQGDYENDYHQHVAHGSHEAVDHVYTYDEAPL